MEHYGITCDCGCMESRKETKGKSAIKEFLFEIIKLLVSSFLVVIGLITQNEISLIGYILSSILLGYQIVFKCFRSIKKKDFFNENTLMLIASIVSFVIGEYLEGTLIIFLYSLGNLLEDVATFNTKSKIAGLKELQCSIVHFVNEKGIEDMPPNQIKIGSILEVRQGEKIPIDGEILGASGEFDTKFITGESNLSVIKNGEQVFSGYVNVGSPILLRTTKLFCDSAVEKMISLVSIANERKSKSQKTISKFAKIYTPIIILLAVLICIIPPFFDNYNYLVWIHKSLSFLVISCPCALIISVPLAYFVGIGTLAKNGILIKGSKFIEILSKIKCFVFDKTGTLTKGYLSVKSIEIEKEFNVEEVLQYVVSIESKSNHPIAKAIVRKFNDIKILKLDSIKEIVGQGIIARIEDKEIKIGNIDFIGKDLIKEQNMNEILTTIYICIDNKFVGKILVEDQVKEESKLAIRRLKEIGIKKTIMLSGDKENVANIVGEKVGIDKVFSQLLPQDKLDCLQKIRNEEKTSCGYVGDGVNDLLVLNASDIGISMGALGSDIAIENSDMVILDDNLLKIPYSLRTARSIQKTVIFNIVFSLFCKFSIMIFSLFMTVPIWLVMFADVGVMLICVLNSLRLSLKKFCN